MIRRTVGAVVATTAALLMAVLWVGSSWADTAPPYPAPPVTGDPLTSVVTTAPAQVVTSSAVALPVQPAAAPPSDLASTGAGFNVGLTVGIGLLIIVVGIALVVMGARRSRRAGHA